MILQVFVVLFLVAVGLILFGEFIDVSLSMLGLGLMFILGVVLIGGDLEYKTGQNVTYNYTYNNDTDTTIRGVTESRTDLYAGLSGSQNHLFGWSLSVGGALGFFAVLMQLRRRTRDEEDGE